MTVRQAELLMALATIAMSLGLMWSSTSGLEIGWVPQKGPGSGFWPFWLSVGLLLASATTLYRWFTRATPESRSDEPYMTADAMRVVGTAVGALLALLIGTQFIGIYVSLLLFMLFYIRFVGKHSWPATVMFAGGVPIFIFALFDWALQIPLPKSMTEEWYYPVYDLMYESDDFGWYVAGSFAVLGLIAFLLHKLLPGE